MCLEMTLSLSQKVVTVRTQSHHSDEGREERRDRVRKGNVFIYSLRIKKRLKQTSSIHFAWLIDWTDSTVKHSFIQHLHLRLWYFPSSFRINWCVNPNPRVNFHQSRKSVKATFQQFFILIFLMKGIMEIEVKMIAIMMAVWVCC